MKKLIYLIIAIVALGLIVCGCIPVVPPAEQDNLNTFTKSSGSVVWVDDDFDSSTLGWGTTHFDKIQDGVDTVAVGGTVNVANGNYNATSSPFVRITKPLSLVGESRDGVIIDGSGTSTIGWAKGIHVTANNVSIENLTVQNFGAVDYWGYGIVFRDYAHDTSGEGFIYYDSCMVENVCSQNNCYPMYAFCYTNLTICNCLIQDNLSDGMFIAKGSDNAVITGNTVLNSGDHGIWVGGSGWCEPSCDNAIITDNYIDGAREGGISFVASNGAIISGNTITNAAGEGWSVGALSLKDGPSNVEAYNNTIHNNSGNGIGIDGTPSNIYLNYNKIYDNTGYGVYNYSEITIDATHNWWGHASGPGGEEGRTNPAGKIIGKGDEVSINVNWDPWLSQPIVPLTQILNKWDFEGTFEAHPTYNWGGLAEGATWDYSIHIKEAMSGEFSVGSIRLATVDNTVDIEVIGIVEQTKTSYNYSSWADWDTLAAAGRAKYNGETYNFLFLFSEHAMWFAISHCDLEPYWTNEDVWHGLDREYDLLSKIPDETFIVDPKSIH